MRERVAELEHLARDVREDGYRRAAVLGMGGSSLAPELFSRVFGWAGGDAGSGAASAGALELRVLDSTHPDAVRGFRSWASEQRTLFLVSSKSGSTTEPNAFQAAMGEIAPALDFIAITDPDTPLAELARAQEFRAIVTAPPDVGGRYSALTVFGLVPAALHGVDLAGLLDRAQPDGGRMPNAGRAGESRAAPRSAPRRGRARRPRQAHAAHRRAPGRLRRLGGAARRESRPARRGRGSSRSSASRCASRMPMPTTASSFGSGWPARTSPSSTRSPTRSKASATPSSASSLPILSTWEPSSCAGRWPRPRPGSRSGSTRSTSPTSRSRRTPRPSSSPPTGPAVRSRSRCRSSASLGLRSPPTRLRWGMCR